MANAIMLCFSSADVNRLKLASLYWETAPSGEWKYKVKQIAEHFGVPVYQVPTVANTVAEAFIVGNHCLTCGHLLTAKSRSDFMSASPQRICQSCADRERRQEEEERTQLVKEERDRQNTIWLRETSKEIVFDYQSMCYLDAFYAFVLLVNSELNEMTGEIVLPKAGTFSPAPYALRRIIVQLHDKNILLFGKETPLDAFEVDENDVQSFKYNPGRVSWRFAFPRRSESFDRILGELSGVVDSREEHEDYATAIECLWWQIGHAEAKRHLDLQLHNYNLKIDEGNKLREAIRYALQHFSIPELRYLVWKLAKDTAAYAARRDVNRYQVLNSIPGNLIRLCDKALADQWVITPYVLKWDEEESLVTTTLFDRVLRIGVDGFRTITGKSLSDLVASMKKVTPKS
jgi:hypothetical protein